MRKYSPIENFKYLVILLLLLIPVRHGYSSEYQQSDTTKARDTLTAANDSLNVAPIDSLKASADTTNQPLPDSIVYKRNTFKAEELVRGERLFYGLAYLRERAVNCASCHNTSVNDSVNWNPDALEISRKYLDKTAFDLSKILLKPAGQKMSEVHKDFNLTPEDIVLIKAYMNEFVEIGLRPDKPIITNLFLFIVATLLLLFAIIDLTITKKIRIPGVHMLIVAITGIFITYTLVINAIAIGRSKDYSPVQPIKFSHAVHAGQNQTDCIYCHYTAPMSKTAGIPPLNVCMNCHLVVRTGKRSGVFEISKVVAAYENRTSIQWIQVHNMPDHVFFSHAQHVTAGGVDCQECHGDVKSMDVVKQVSDMSMGWCIECHRSRKVDFKDNAFYSQYGDLAEKLKRNEIDSVTVSMVGGTECMKCHY